LRLQGFESEPLRARCSCREPGSVLCAHVRLLVTQLLDAAHDPHAPLHAELLRVCATPSWVRFMDALEPSDDGGAEADERLVWKLRVSDAGAVAMAPALQRRSAQGAWSAGARVQAAALPPSLPLEPQDQLALALLRDQSPGKDGFYEVGLASLRVLLGHPLLFAGEPQRPVVLEETRVELDFEHVHTNVTNVTNGTDVTKVAGVRARTRLGLQPLAAMSEPPSGDHLARLERDGKLTFAPLSAAVARILWALSTHATVLPEESFTALRQRLLPLQAHATLHLSEGLRGQSGQAPQRLLLRLAPAAGEGLRASLHARPLPFGPVFLPGRGPAEALGERDGRRTYALRDLIWERETAAELAEALRFALGFEEGPLRVRFDTIEDSLLLIERVARHADRLDVEWLDGKPSLRLAAPIRRGDLKLKVSEGRRWFEASGHATSDAGARVELADLLEAARTGQRFVRVAAGCYAELHEALRARLEQMQHVVYSERDRIKLAACAVPRLLELPQEPAQVELSQPVAAVLERMQRAETLLIEPPEAIGALPRPYQREGVRFLLRLATWSGGACLADDMGLGKTLQALAVLVARRALGPALVVAPTSVCDNWLHEARRFAPELRLRLYRGPKRAGLLEGLAAGDVLVTSYELLLRDAAALRAHAFASLVLDEAHMLKNARTARARAAAAISAEFRIALTGTPVENHSGELWSLMAQLNPAVLGSFRRFRTHFGLPIERYDDRERLSVLRRIVSPFVLRRTKLEVAPELPARIELTKSIALSEREQALYDTAVADLRQRVGSRRHMQLDRVALLSELTRLRQLACHPRLLMPELVMESSKVRALLDMLEQLLPLGHRALVFSQFVSHLRLVQEALAARAWPQLYLDGSTPAAERGELVQRWQRGEGSLFLISLKAGGTGLNLTGADYVFHLDPWWNPAAEDQASDRAHRIGQARPVTIVRLVARATIEEQVMQMHAEKRELAGALLADTGAARWNVDELAQFLGLPLSAAAEPRSSETPTPAKA
jgi:superfamily II DNA or RNA helicase